MSGILLTDIEHVSTYSYAVQINTDPSNHYHPISHYVDVNRYAGKKKDGEKISFDLEQTKLDEGSTIFLIPEIETGGLKLTEKIKRVIKRISNNRYDSVRIDSREKLIDVYILLNNKKHAIIATLDSDMYGLPEPPEILL